MEHVQIDLSTTDSIVNKAHAIYWQIDSSEIAAFRRLYRPRACWYSDISICLDGIERSYTLDEFKHLLGFDTEDVAV